MVFSTIIPNSYFQVVTVARFIVAQLNRQYFTTTSRFISHCSYDLILHAQLRIRCYGLYTNHLHAVSSSTMTSCGDYASKALARRLAEATAEKQRQRQRQREGPHPTQDLLHAPQICRDSRRNFNNISNKDKASSILQPQLTSKVITMESLPQAEEQAVLFRPSKKRKIYRQRAANDEDDVEAAPSPIPAVAEEMNTAQGLDELIASASGAAAMAELDGAEVEGVAVPMSEILRLRKKNKRMGGVEFKASTRLRGDGGEGTGAMVQAEGGGQDSTKVGVQRSFAPPTGAVGDVNKHM